jgi:hypothetical protein
MSNIGVYLLCDMLCCRTVPPSLYLLPPGQGAHDTWAPDQSALVCQTATHGEQNTSTVYVWRMFLVFGWFQAFKAAHFQMHVIFFLFIFENLQIGIIISK